ncbi:MAG: hypothetical protein ACJAR2_000275 [Ilumatobacter sp.]|jgi:hypothetical protein
MLVLLVVLVAVVALEGIGRHIRASRTIKNRELGILECAFRDSTGQTSDLLQRWRHCRAHISPSRITLEPFIPLGIRMRRPFTAPIELEVESVSTVLRDNTTLEAWSFRGSVREVTTSNGVIEWGIAHAHDDAWPIELVAPAPPPIVRS